MLLTTIHGNAIKLVNNLPAMQIEHASRVSGGLNGSQQKSFGKEKAVLSVLMLKERLFVFWWAGKK